MVVIDDVVVQAFLNSWLLLSLFSSTLYFDNSGDNLVRDGLPWVSTCALEFFRINRFHRIRNLTIDASSSPSASA